MKPKDPQTALDTLEQEFLQEGKMESAPLDLSKTSQEQQAQYRALLTAERLFRPEPIQLTERLGTPTVESLHRGSLHVLEQLGFSAEEVQEAVHSTKAKYTQEETTSQPVAEPLSAAGNRKPSKVYAQETSLLARFIESLQRHWWAVPSVAMLWLILWFGTAQEQHIEVKGFRSKGPVDSRPPVKQKPLIHLHFGVGKGSHPSKRGLDGMEVKADHWLYFSLEQAKSKGYLYFIQTKYSGRLKKLLPRKQAPPTYQQGPKKWALQLQGIALRYRVRSKHKRMGFFVVLSPTPLSSKKLLVLKQSRQRFQTSSEARIWLSKNLGVNILRINGFVVKVGP